MNLNTLGYVALAVLALVASTQFEIPLPASPIRYSAQSLAIVILGGLLGATGSFAAVVLYIAIGVLGAPVFQHGGAGWLHLMGPTGGFLIGFLPAAVFMGIWMANTGTRSFIGLLTGAMLTHAIILTAGWVGLSLLHGPSSAWSLGVRPFLDAALFKSILGALVLFCASFLRPLPWLTHGRSADKPIAEQS